MSVMTSFTRRSLAKNRMRTVVSIIGIALSVALITAIWTTVASLQQGLYQRTIATEGWWQVYVQGAADETIDAMEQSDNITDTAVSHDGGVAWYSERESETLGSGLIVKSLPQAAKGQVERDGAGITCLPEVTEGRAPEALGEVMLPERLRGTTLGGEDGGGIATDGVLTLGGSIALDVCRYVPADPDRGSIASTLNAVQEILAGGAVVDAQGAPIEGYGGSAASEEPRAAAKYEGGAMLLASRERMEFSVVGFYDDSGAHYTGNDFVASSDGVSLAITAPGGVEMVSGGQAGAGDALTGCYTDVWAATQGFGSLDEITGFVSGLPYEGTGLYYGDMVVYAHGNLTRYQGISNGSLLQDSLTAMAGILALVVAVASVSLIYNSFSISVAERTRQFGLLASLGASKRQLRRSVLVEALMLGAVGIPCGILLGISGTAAVLQLTGAGFSALLGVDEGLALAVEPASLAISAALSLVALLVSAWIPALRAGRVSAVDAIRQVQDVRLSKRAQRKAARGARTSAASAAPFSKRSDGGLWGLVADVPGIIAHRNLSRQSARGRIVVMSLAVSVVLVVTAGAVAVTMDPIVSRAGSAAGASSDADITLMASGSDSQNDELSAQAEQFDGLLDEAASLEGVSLDGVVRQGSMEVALPAGMISEAGRDAIQQNHDLGSASWSPQPFGQDGAYYGRLEVFYLDERSFSQTAESLGVGDLDFADPGHPRAIALNAYQGVTTDAAYLDIDPFAQTGSFRAYCGATVPEGFSSLGVVEGEDGVPALGLIDQASAAEGDPAVERVSLDSARSVQIDVVALAPETPPIANLMSASRGIPVLLMSDEITKAADGAAAEDAPGERLSAIEHVTPFSYSFATATFQADDHESAVEQLREMADGYAGLTVNVVDLVVSAESTRLAFQTIQVFILCFTVIMALIAVANVFNTLTNSIILRTREFAVLKSVGMGDRAFARMLVCECASYALRGLVAGLVLAVLVAWALYQALGIAFRGVDFSLPWPYVGAAVALVLVVLAISVAFALRKSHAANVVEALRADAV